MSKLPPLYGTSCVARHTNLPCTVVLQNPPLHLPHHLHATLSKPLAIAVTHAHLIRWEQWSDTTMRAIACIMLSFLLPSPSLQFVCPLTLAFSSHPRPHPPAQRTTWCVITHVAPSFNLTLSSGSRPHSPCSAMARCIMPIMPPLFSLTSLPTPTPTRPPLHILIRWRLWSNSTTCVIACIILSLRLPSPHLH